MITYQEYLEAAERNDTVAFIESAIAKHKSSAEYAIAADADQYMRKQNTTIRKFQRLVYDAAGNGSIDAVGANFHCASGFFKQIVAQLTQTLLANGVSFKNPDTKDKLGGELLDRQLAEVTENALVGGISFGLFNGDKVERVFKLTEFIPMWDEVDGTLKAGIYFWQIADNKPLRADLYTLDGKQSFIRLKGEKMRLMDGFEQPQPYRLQRAVIPFDNSVLYEVAQNYPTLPIVPMYGNKQHQSELIGLKENIDAYDLTKCGLINDISDMPTIYWVLENAGGMSEKNLAYWRDSIRRNHVVKTDDEVKVTANSIGVQHDAHDAVLERLEKDIYNDSMTLNTRELAAGNVTATAVRAASDPLHNRLDELEYLVGDFVRALLALIGVDDVPSFNRSRITNQLEEIQAIMQTASVLDTETIIRKLPIFTPEEAEAAIERSVGENMDRFVEAEPEAEAE